MPKTIVLQAHNEKLIELLHAKGYKVIDIYEAHSRRTPVDAYLYTTYHPDAFTSYYSAVNNGDEIMDDTSDAFGFPASILLNISQLSPEQVVSSLERRLNRHDFAL